MGGSNLASSAFIAPSSNIAASFDPLASSTPNPGTYGEVDPWSAVPSPSRSGTPRRDSIEVNDGERERFASVRNEGNGGGGLSREGLNAFMSGSLRLRIGQLLRAAGDPPTLYLSLLDQLDPSTTGQVSLASVHRVLATSRLPAATVERVCEPSLPSGGVLLLMFIQIINLTARDKASLTRQELFCALGLVALAQSGSDDDEITIERLSASLPDLPLPRLSVPSASNPTTAARLPDSPGDSSSSSPWDAAAAAPQSNGGSHTRSQDVSGYSVSGSRIDQDAFEASDKGYWRRLESIDVTLVPEKEGWFTQKYKLESDVSNLFFHGVDAYNRNELEER